MYGEILKHCKSSSLLASEELFWIFLVGQDGLQNEPNEVCNVLLVSY